MKNKWVPWSIVLLGIIAFVAAPGLRGVLQALYYGPEEPTPRIDQIALEDEAAKYPKEALIPLAALELQSFADYRSYFSQEDFGYLIADYEKVSALDPNSPLPHLRLGMRLLSHSGELNRPEEGQMRSHYRDKGPREPEQQYCLEKAIVQFRKAAALSPDNCAPDFLLAYACLANRQDSLADKALQSALAKPKWQLDSPELALAEMKLLETGLVPHFWGADFALETAMVRQSDADMKLQKLAGLLAYLAAAKSESDLPLALLYAESDLNLGERMMRQERGQLGQSVGAVTLFRLPRYFVPKASWDKLALGDRKAAQELWKKAQQEFEDFLRAEGRADLVESYRQALAEEKRISDNLPAASRSKAEKYPSWGDMIKTSRFRMVLLNLFQILLVGVLIILVGLLSLLIRAWEEKRPLPTWRGWQWGLLSLACLLSVYYLAHTYAEPRRDPGFFLKEPDLQSMLASIDRAEYTGNRAMFLLALESVGLLLVLATVFSLLLRHRQAAELRLEKASAVLACFRKWLPVTLALLLLAAVIFSIPAHLTLKRWDNTAKEILQQGEVKYFRFDP
jgi:hypothetical protein